MNATKRTLRKDINATGIDWSRHIKEIARELGVSVTTAYLIKNSFRKKPPKGGWVDPEAELLWTIDTLDRCARVREKARAVFGKNLRSWRKRCKIKQISLAEVVLGTKRRSNEVCGWESGEFLPGPEPMKKLIAFIKENTP